MENSQMTSFVVSRRMALSGIAAVGAMSLCTTSFVPRAYAQAPSGPFKLDPLPYANNKNEPHIDAMTMEIHHDRHHAAYVNNLNGAARTTRCRQEAVARAAGQARTSVPESIRTRPQQRRRPRQPHDVLADHGRLGRRADGRAEAAIERDFGGLAKFQDAVQRARAAASSARAGCS